MSNNSNVNLTGSEGSQFSAIAAFDGSAHHYALQLEPRLLKVWETHHGKVKYVIMEEGEDRKAIGWSGTGMIWSGYKAGVQLWQLASATLAASLSQPGSSFTAFAVSSDGLRELTRVKGHTTKITLSQSGKYMALVHNSIRVFQLKRENSTPKDKKDETKGNDKRKKEKEDEGEKKAIRCGKLRMQGAIAALAFSPDDRYIASLAANDRVIRLLATPTSDISSEDNNEASNHSNIDYYTLNADSALYKLRFNNFLPYSEKKEKAVYHVLAVNEAGSVQIWSFSSKDLEDKTGASRKPKCTINTNTKSSTSNFYDATFCSKDEVLLVRGTISKPIFERRKYIDDTGEILKEIIMHVEVASNTQVEFNRGPKVVEYVSAADTSKAITSKLPSTKKRKADEVDMTIEEKLQSEGLLTINTNQDDSKVPRADSVQHLLVQALQAKDAALLETCLNLSDSKVINSTCSKLSAEWILPLLGALVHRLQAKPSRAALLIIWIRAVLTSHTPYLLSVPDLVKSLAPLYQVVDSRLAVFKKLLTLSGRLDLVISSRNTKKQTNYQPTIYNEEIPVEDQSESEGSEDHEDQDNASEDEDREIEGQDMELDNEDEEEAKSEDEIKLKPTKKRGKKSKQESESE